MAIFILFRVHDHLRYMDVIIAFNTVYMIVSNKDSKKFEQDIYEQNR